MQCTASFKKKSKYFSRRLGRGGFATTEYKTQVAFPTLATIVCKVIAHELSFRCHTARVDSNDPLLKQLKKLPEDVQNEVWAAIDADDCDTMNALLQSQLFSSVTLRRFARNAEWISATKTTFPG
jgi:hypothetical protein